jgi:hypothetical protein
MEPEGSLACSQESSIGPYPEPDQSNPYHSILSNKNSVALVRQQTRLTERPPLVGEVSASFSG